MSSFPKFAEETSQLDAIWVHVLFIVPPILGLIFTAVMWTKVRAVKVEPLAEAGQLLSEETDRCNLLNEYAGYISEGAITFLMEEYKWMVGYVVLMAIIILAFYAWALNDTQLGVYTTIAFIVGAVTSILCGYIGMKAAVMTNVRTTFTCWQDDFSEGLKIALRGGSIMGFGLTSIGVVVLYVLILIFRFMLEMKPVVICEALAGFGLGASSIALFGRVGGGIYTKAADVGADLSGKIDQDMNEDDPRNPACIADNVGDNVGDIAGMGADLFGSFAESTVAALVIAASSQSLPKSDGMGMVYGLGNNLSGLYFPVLISSTGIVVGIITMILCFWCCDAICDRFMGDDDMTPRFDGIEWTLKLILIISTILETPVVILLGLLCLPQEFALEGRVTGPWPCIISILMGLWAGLLIGLVTEYYTSYSYYPVRELAENQISAAATGIIYGLSLGYRSCIFPVLALTAVIVTAHSLVGMYGVALGALGMLSTLSASLTIDAYGPVSDNAGGLAEMAKLDSSVREVTDALDAAGNTTAAIGKGFAIGSAALVALALFGAFKNRAGIAKVDVAEAWTFSGLFIGALLPYAFSAMTMKSVSIAAKDMVNECARQFPLILGKTGREPIAPDYEKCIRISTQASLQEMVAPGLLVILSPLVVGIAFGKMCAAGMLVGALVSGVQLAISMSNSGGAWDNSKKFLKSKDCNDWLTDVGLRDADGKIDQVRLKEAKNNSITGDTVGDPLKDTSGPSLNILIKLSAITSLVFATVISHYSNTDGAPFWITARTAVAV